MLFLFLEQPTLGTTSKNTKQKPTEDVNSDLTENTTSPATIPPTSSTTTAEATTTTGKAKQTSTKAKVNHSLITSRAPRGLQEHPYLALIIIIYVI